MHRTTTTHLQTFTRPSTATFHLNHPTPHTTTITLPPNSTWSSGLHWHETHTEFLSVVKGAAFVRLGGVLRILRPEDGVVVVEKGVRHLWRRVRREDKSVEGFRGADRERSELNGIEEELAEELIVQEWTDPQDGEKESFFRNLNSLILDTMVEGEVKWWGEYWLMWQLFIIFWKCDNWPVFLMEEREGGALVRSTQWVVVKFVLGGAMLFGRLFGVGGLWKEYTPGIDGRKSG